MRVLVTGGVRSGKSVHAERLLSDEPVVRYVAAGPTYDDADWHARVAQHQERRAGHWETVETSDIAAAIASAPGAVIVECLGTWVNAIVDEASLWDAPTDEVTSLVVTRLEPVLAAISSATRPVVLVTNEVGLGIVPAHRSGRLFRDLVGTVNLRVGAVVDEVHLVVAGRVLKLG